MVRNPSAPRSKKSKRKKKNPKGVPFVPTTIEAPDDPIEFFDQDLDDSVMQAVLQRAYKMFKMLNGTFEDIVEQCGMEFLKKKLQLFLHYYVATVRFSQLCLFTDIHGLIAFSFSSSHLS